MNVSAWNFVGLSGGPLAEAASLQHPLGLMAIVASIDAGL